MQATEPHPVPPRPSARTTPGLEDRLRTPPHEERPAPRWELSTPELRYAVASLEHWLDLNG